MLVDEAKIQVQGGRGGDGIIAWRREKFIDRGGPEGGDGGAGGSVYAKQDHNISSLERYRSQNQYKALNGENGLNKKKHGASGEDLILSFPPGTIIEDEDNNKIIVDFSRESPVESKNLTLLARGGRGGWGNTHFARPDDRAPEKALAGQAGQTKTLTLKLDLIADVALIGLPNSGKSSLLKVLTGKEGRIAEFAFSTTEPLLGVWQGASRRLTFIDLPGLIAGAYQGKGLGDKFLHHLSRVKVLVHLIDSTSDNLKPSEEIIREEMRRYDERILSLPTIICLTKCDLLNSYERKKAHKTYPEAILLSSLTHCGIDELTDRLCRIIMPVS